MYRHLETPCRLRRLLSIGHRPTTPDRLKLENRFIQGAVDSGTVRDIRRYAWIFFNVRRYLWLLDIYRYLQILTDVYRYFPPIWSPMTETSPMMTEMSSMMTLFFSAARDWAEAPKAAPDPGRHAAQQSIIGDHDYDRRQ